MRTRLLSFIALTLTTGPTPGADAPGQPKPADRPIPAKDAARAMTVPAGFKVTLFAGEPDVVQPIAMTFDDRGRLWVVECLSYPKWRADGKGNDRVVILEDADGDGTFDKRTVFLDNGSNLSGIELGFGGVWLCSVPNLIFIPVKDGEDRPAGPPQVVLDGWNLKDTKHNIFNSLAWGPDGWLYGLNGIQSKSRVGRPGTPDKDRVFFDCGVWRYHPTRKTFEVFAWGTTNPFGLDWDDHGEMVFTNCVIHHLWHVVPGAHYERMYGDDPTPHVYGYMKSCADHLHWGGGSWTSSRSTGAGGSPQHSEAGGGHAHSGCAVYLGDNFPPEYRNSVFMCNIHGNRLNRDRLERTPAGYVGKHAPDFLFANDSWFRGICVKTGPEGGLYVTDWSDTGECHNYDKADLTNGRIFRVVYGTPAAFRGDLAKLPDAALVEMQTDRNDWAVRKSRRLLQERAAAGTIDPQTEPALRKLLLGGRDVTRRLRAAWVLHAIGKLTADDQTAMMADASDHVRAWGVTLAFEVNPFPNPSPAIAAFQTLCKSEASPFVRARLAGVLQRIDPKIAPGFAAMLLSRAEDNADPNLALLYWYAVRPAALANPSAVLDLAFDTPIRLVRQNAVRCALSNPGADADRIGRQIVFALSAPQDTGRKLDILRGMKEAYAGRKTATAPPGWTDLGGFAVGSTPEVRQLADELSVLFGDRTLIGVMKERILKGENADDRRRAVALLAGRATPDLAPVLRAALADPVVRAPAIRGLAAYPDPATPPALLKLYPSLPAAEKADAVLTLASRPPFAAALLDAVETGTVPRADVSVVAARQVVALNDRAITDRLEKVWGSVRAASKERTALIKKWKGELTADALKTADKSRGRALFAQHCATCHKLFGEGTEFGPDLTGSQRANLDYVLENVLDPSAVVPREFKVTNFTLADGRVVGGTVERETADGVTVRTTNETVVLAVRDIEARKPTNQSVMPDGLFDKLKPDEVRDLVAYMTGREQVPLPKKE